MRARLKDVAALAGVATNTASTILNRRPNSWASKETAARVFKAAEELGYKPSRAALGLRLGSFKTVGLIIPDLHNPVYTTFADLLERRMRESGYDLILEHSRTDLNYEKHCLDSILDRQIDAVTYFVSDLESHLEFLKRAAKTSKHVVALTGPSAESFPFDAVEMDFYEGITAAVEHLLELWHERFAFLCALAKGQEAGDRPNLFNQMLKERGIPENQNSFIPCAHDLQSARSTFGAFLDGISGPKPTALIAMNDLTAIGAMRAASERGIRVPEDLSVIGVDNIPLGRCLPRQLTTIAQPLEDLANTTAEFMLQRLDKKSEVSAPLSRKFKAKLLIKETTARPPAR
ncbi:MAG: LacI family DNA-binding transcriptional regulator [Lentimonas sp.]